jgi:DNA-directed RNA polymerase subunit F
LLAEKVRVKEAVNRALSYVTGLEKKEKEPLEHLVTQLTDAIQKLQQKITYLELRIVPNTLQDVRGQREAIS